MADVVVLVAAQAGSTATTTPPRRGPGPRTSSSRRGECSPPPSSRSSLGGTCTCTARRANNFRSSPRPSATTDRNNPEAVYYQRGPFTPDDITASRPIADPFHLLDCATTSEGGCALVVANVDKDRRGAPTDLRVGQRRGLQRPVVSAPTGVGPDRPARRSTRTAWSAAHAADRRVRSRRTRPRRRGRAGTLRPVLVRDHRQLEAFRFCREGEGGPFVADGHIAIGGSHPVTTDGGTMSFSHAGTNPQMMQRAIRARSADPRRGRRPCRCPTRISRCAATAERARCSPPSLLLGDEPR